MSIQTFLTDYSGQKQPMLVLLRTNGSTGKWRLNFNQQKIFGNAGFNPDGTMAVLFRTIGQHKRC